MCIRDSILDDQSAVNVKLKLADEWAKPIDPLTTDAVLDLSSGITPVCLLYTSEFVNTIQKFFLIDRPVENNTGMKRLFFAFLLNVGRVVKNNYNLEW